MDEDIKKQEGSALHGKINFEDTENEKKEVLESLVDQLQRDQNKEVPSTENLLPAEHSEEGGPPVDTEYSSSIIKPIRTFARDVEEFKKRTGITEDIQLENDLVPEKKKGTYTKKPEQEIEGVVPVERGEFLPKEPIEIQKKVPPEELYQDQARAFEAQLKESSFEKTEQKTDRSYGAMSPIRTYKYDAAESIKDKNVSVVSIAAAESNRRAREPRYRPQPPKGSTFTKNFAIIVMSIALVSSGLGIGWFFFIKASENTGIAPRAGIPSIIFTDQQTEVSIAGLYNNQLVAKLEDQRKKVTEKSNTVTHLYLTETGRVLPAETFISRLSINVPSALTRSVSSDFMFGVHIKDGSNPFFIFKTNDFEQTFASMLEWENTINKDLAPLFGSTLGAKRQETENSGGLTIPRTFHDVVVRNVDTRLLRDDNGTVILFYAFPNPNTIVITNNEDTFFEIFKRLSTSRGQSN